MTEPKVLICAESIKIPEFMPRVKVLFHKLRISFRSLGPE